jgi:putative membrane protein
MFTFEWTEILDLYEILATLAYWIIMLILAGICMLLFEWITPYNDREELLKGNVAVGIQFAGKLIGIGIITKASIAHNVSIWGASIWVFIGFFLMIISYFLFELITPFKVEQEIKKNNIAVAIVAASLSIFIGFAVAGSIT